MNRFLLVAAAVAASGGGGWLAISAADDRGSDRSERPGRATDNPCPAHVTKLGPDAIARATDATLKESATIFRAKNRRGMYAASALVAGDDNAGAYARVTCGRRVFERTVVVTLRFPAMEPSASLSSGTVVVSPVRGRYVVWDVVH